MRRAAADRVADDLELRFRVALPYALQNGELRGQSAADGIKPLGPRHADAAPQLEPRSGA